MLSLPVQNERFDQLDGYTYPRPLDNRVELPSPQAESPAREQRCRCRIDMRDLRRRIFELLLLGEFVSVCREDGGVKLQDVNGGMFHM